MDIHREDIVSMGIMNIIRTSVRSLSIFIVLVLLTSGLPLDYFIENVMATEDPPSRVIQYDYVDGTDINLFDFISTSGTTNEKSSSIYIDDTQSGFLFSNGYQYGHAYTYPITLEKNERYDRLYFEGCTGAGSVEFEIIDENIQGSYENIPFYIIDGDTQSGPFSSLYDVDD